MDIDTTVLRAILRLSRRREAADDEALVLRTGSSPARVRAAIRRLDAAGLVQVAPRHPPRLTLTGLAVAVALLPVRSGTARQPGHRTTRAA
jgi:Mn-dependent DtxR family transcriptional regulator